MKMGKRIKCMIKTFKELRNKLAFKLIFWIGIILVIFLEVACYLDLRSHRELLINQMKQEAERLSDIIKRSTYHDMLRARSNELQEVIETIGAQDEVRRVRIIERGKVKMTSHKAELNKKIDKKAEACYDCHIDENKKPLTITRYRFFKTRDGERVLGLVNPIENNKECQSCHGTDSKVLGVLDIILSMEDVYKDVKEHQMRSLFFVITCFLLIAITICIFIFKFVNNPIKELAYGTRLITSGDLDYHIPIHCEDELGELATSFNNMTDKLKASIKEIEGWNQELSDRVKQATRELEEANKELEIANQKLSQSDRKKSEVVMLVAHDIRAPLAAIQSCLKVVLDGYLKSNREKELEMIGRAEERVESQLEFVKNLLDFSRMEDDHRELSPIPLSPVILNVVDIMHTWANDKGIRVETRDLCDVTLMGDEDLLNRTLTNLISNAIKYNPPGTQIWVDCKLQGNQIEIEVGDNGVGIPEDEVPNIFEILFRGVQAKRQHEHGSGLGLSIVKRAVKLHGGKITVESKINEGTRFYITLPILKGKASKGMKKGEGKKVKEQAPALALAEER